MALKLMGKKRGMTQLFDEQGNAVVCTVIEVESNVVTQIKTKERDGYNAIQLGFGEIKTKDPRTAAKRAKKPLFGHFEKAGLAPRRHLAESRIENVQDYTLGQEIGAAIFADTHFVDATGQSRGKGYQGVMKLHGYAGGPAAHGSTSIATWDLPVCAALRAAACQAAIALAIWAMNAKLCKVLKYSKFCKMKV